MRLGDLLDVPHLRLTLLTGARGRDRQVRRVYTTDLPDPGRYLTGGELVLTGGVWHHGPADAETFVASLRAGRVAGLGVGLAAFHSVPADIVAACRRHAIALVEVPAEISFADLADVVAARLDAERGLSGALARQRRLVAAAESGAGLLAVVSAELGVACWTMSATGRAAGGSAGRGTAAGLRRAVLRARALPAVVAGPDATAVSVFPIGADPAVRSRFGFLACAGDHRDWPAEHRDAVAQVAALLAEPRVRLTARQLIDAEATRELVELALGGDAGVADLGRRLAALGIAPATPLVVLRARVTGGPPEWAATALEEVTEGAAVATIGDGAAAVVPGAGPGAVAGAGPGAVAGAGADSVAAAVRAEARWLELALRTGRVAIGIGAAPDGAAGLHRALVAAGHAADLAASRADRVAVASSDEIDSHGPLLALLPEAVREAFRERVLGPVIRYDTAHGSELVPTLAAFLDASGSWQRCAERLHLHVNTLRYRIGCVEKLTGRDLSTLSDRVDFLLALRALGDLGKSDTDIGA